MVRITLLTDFGTDDGYAGALKGVLSTRAPEALVEDISHSVPPGDVGKASRILGRYWRRFQPGTVHLVVVDPGVGTRRRGLATEADGRFLVGPDNGVFSRVLSDAALWRAFDLSRSELLPAPSSTTFHGRDWFAPAAAMLATGTSIDSLGVPVPDPVILSDPEPVTDGDWVSGEVLEVDRFGNLVTNIPGERILECGAVEIAGVGVRVRATYGDAAVGELLALVNSDGVLEVAVRDGSAARKLGVGLGAGVRTRTGGAS